MTTERIIKELGIESSSDAFKARMVGKILATADLRFARMIDEAMTEEEHREFQMIAKSEGPKEIEWWVNEKYEGVGNIYTDIVTSIVMDLKNHEI